MPNVLSAALPILMTLVTVDAVVDISRHLIVLEVVRVVASVAARALEDRVVVRVDVAGRANIARSAMTRGELRVLGVIKSGVGPGSCVVAVLACLREELRLRRMARVSRFAVVGAVAAVAIRRQRCVVVVNVTVRANARRNLVRTGKGEGCVVVIERGVGPYIGVVTKFAGRGESCRLVSWIIRARVILLMARVAKRAVQ